MSSETDILTQQTPTDRSELTRVYRRAPIAEAIIEIRVALQSPISMDSCVNIFNDLRVEFPEIKRRELIRLEHMGGELKTDQTTDATVMSSSETMQNLVIGPTVFGFTKLAPYTNWVQFRDTAKRYWQIYSERLKPTRAVRVATRFVNRIEIPLPIMEIRDYFATGPMLGPGMSDFLSGFYMQLQLPQGDLGCMANLNEALIPSADENVASFLLDIDVFEEGDFSDLNYPWQRLEAFRTRKNRIFESCITDRTRELFG